MMTLYHGSNVVIDKIDLACSRKGKDFGCGFYLNANYGQAHDMAVRTTERMGWGTPTVTSFCFDESVLCGDSGLKVVTFDDYSVEWAEYVLANRNYRESGNTGGYDIVVGPIADDTVGLQIYRLKRKYVSINQFIDELRFRGSKAVQYYFGTARAVALLSRI